MSKEQFEWIHSFCNDTNNTDLPRILLIGDSICFGYQKFVCSNLKGKFYVDYLSTSYSLDNPFYIALIKEFVKNSKYDFIHFNYGLHGKHMSGKLFNKKVNKIIDLLKKYTKQLTLCNITIVKNVNNIGYDTKWMRRVYERNTIYLDIAKKENLAVDDLYTLSLSIDNKLRKVDGTHYLNGGNKLLGKKVSDFIKENFKE